MGAPRLAAPSPVVRQAQWGAQHAAHDVLRMAIYMAMTLGMTIHSHAA
jgi:hypothetical protein